MKIQFCTKKMLSSQIIFASIISLSTATEIVRITFIFMTARTNSKAQTTYSSCLVSMNSIDSKRGDLCCPCLGPIQCIIDRQTTISVDDGEAIIGWFPEDASSKATYPSCLRYFRWPKSWQKVYFDENWCLRDQTFGNRKFLSPSQKKAPEENIISRQLT